MALLGQQMQDESRQRLEADLASQILGMDLTRKAQQEQEIKDLEADLYETIPFKRSQAHVHGDDQAWIDKWEKEVEAELGYRKGYLASMMSTKREIQTLKKTSEGA